MIARDSRYLALLVLLEPRGRFIPFNSDSVLGTSDPGEIPCSCETGCIACNPVRLVDLQSIPDPEPPGNDAELKF